MHLNVFSGFGVNAWITFILMSVLLSLILFKLTESKKAITKKRIRDFKEKMQQKGKNVKANQPLYKRVYLMAEDRIALFLDKQFRKGNFNSLSTKLEQANLTNVTPMQHYAKKILFAVGASLLSLALNNPSVAIGLVLLAFFYPDYKLKERIKLRQQKLRIELPDFLDLLAATYPGVNVLLQAIEEVCNKIDSQISNEFRQAIGEVKNGSKQREAFMRMGMRCGIKELSQLISAINQSELVGAKMEDTLRAQANRIRKTKRTIMELRAKRAAMFLLFPSGLLLLVGIIIMTSPNLVQLLGAMKMFGA